MFIIDDFALALAAEQAAAAAATAAATEAAAQAAATAAAEQAAAQAAAQATAQGASQAGIMAAEQAAAQTAAQAATQTAATNAATSAAAQTGVASEALPAIVEQVIPAGIEQVAPAGIETLVPAGSEPLVPAGIEQLTPAGTEPIIPAGTQPTDIYNQLIQAFKDQAAAPPPGQSPYAQLASGPVTSDVAPAPLVEAPPVAPTSPAVPDIPLPPGPEQSAADVINKALAEQSSSNPFVQGFNDITNWMEKNPFKTATLGYTGLNMMGAFRTRQQPTTFGGPSYTGKGYTLSPNFQPGPYTQPNVYQPRYAQGGILSLQAGGPVERMSQMNTAMNPQGGLYPQGMIDKTQYATPIQRPVSSEMVMEDSAYERSNPMLMASGGITALAKGTPKDYYAESERYLKMTETPKAPAYTRPDVGIMEDTDPDTKYQDALTAALIRQGKINKRVGMGTPVIGRPTPMGTINLAPPGTQQAASGGIMGYNLGGYADGGNPRLLKGPGDGMSDNIPATIANRQPARLADGEFVIPADVVSGLGNGSTNAGARKLHKMMDKVRVARTGKKKQAPEIKAEKYLA